MIKVDLKKWFLTTLRKQTWFGYTYIIMSMDGKVLANSRWHKNSSPIIQAFRAAGSRNGVGGGTHTKDSTDG